jgi:hypothetical protein
MFSSCLFKPHLVIIYPLGLVSKNHIFSSSFLTEKWHKFSLLLFVTLPRISCISGKHKNCPRKYLRSVLWHKYQSERSIRNICSYRHETKHLPHTSFQDQVQYSCAALNQGVISFYIKFWSIVYFNGTAVPLQGFVIAAVAWNVFHILPLDLYLHLNCHRFWYSSKASDVNWTCAREYCINRRGRNIEQKLKALCRFYYCRIFILLDRVL